jgi:hypothetical protein
MDWKSASGLDCFAVIARQIESVCFQLDPHRNPDAWPTLSIVLHSACDA